MTNNNVEYLKVTVDFVSIYWIHEEISTLKIHLTVPKLS